MRTSPEKIAGMARDGDGFHNGFFAVLRPPEAAPLDCEKTLVFLAMQVPQRSAGCTIDWPFNRSLHSRFTMSDRQYRASVVRQERAMGIAMAFQANVFRSGLPVSRPPSRLRRANCLPSTSNSDTRRGDDFRQHVSALLEGKAGMVIGDV